jgi:putative transposase
MKSGLVPHVLKAGTRFSLKNQAYEISFVDTSMVRYSSCEGGRPYLMPVYAFWELVDCKKIGFLSQEDNGKAHDPLQLRLTSLSDSCRKELLRRFQYVKEALGVKSRPLSKVRLVSTIQVISKQLNDEMPPSRATLARWVKRYVNSSGETMALVPLHQRKGCRTKKIPFEVEIAIRNSLIQDYLVVTRPSLKQVHANVVGRINDDQTIPVQDKCFPSVRTLYRRAKELDPYIIARMRHGQRYADAQFRAAGSALQASRLMETVMMDGHRMDVILVDDETGEILGRPYLVCLFDVATRAVVGWHISLLPFCATTALAAIKDMCSRDPREGPGGIAEKILPDNGPDLISQALRSLCMRLGMHIESAKAYCPDDKAHIERFFRTVNMQLVHMLPGTTFSSLHDRGEYDSVALAQVTLTKLRELFGQWLTTVYHRAKHSATRRLPEKLWRDQLSMMPVLSFKSEDIDVIARVVFKRKISNGRVIVDNLIYKSDALRTLEHRNQRSVVVLVNELDLSYVYVHLESDPKTLFRADGVDLEYMDKLTKYEHDACTAALDSMAEKDREELGPHAYEIARWRLWQSIHNLPNSSSAKKLALLTQGEGRKKTAKAKIKRLLSYEDVVPHDVVHPKNTTKPPSDAAENVPVTGIAAPLTDPATVKPQQPSDDDGYEVFEF